MDCEDPELDILIVEGNPLAFETRTATFSDAGHQLTHVRDTDGAMRLLRRGQFDMVLVDPFSKRDWNFGMLAIVRISAPQCHVVMLTAAHHFPAGELYRIMPQGMSIVHAPITDRDLLILCEERAIGHHPKTRNGGPGEAGPPFAESRRSPGRSGARYVGDCP